MSPNSPLLLNEAYGYFALSFSPTPPSIPLSILPLSCWRLSSDVWGLLTAHLYLKAGATYTGQLLGLSPGGFDRRLLPMPTPISFLCSCVFLPGRTLQPPPWVCVSQDRPCSKDEGARAPVGLESPMGPQGNSHNLMVSGSLPSGLGGSYCPSLGDSGLLWAGNELPFCSLTGQVGEVHPGVCSHACSFSGSFQPPIMPVVPVWVFMGSETCTSLILIPLFRHLGLTFPA